MARALREQEWYDFILGENARIEIESNHRLQYYGRLFIAQRERHSNNAMRLAFFVGSAVIPFCGLLHAISSTGVNNFGYCWNWWDSLYGAIASERDISTLISNKKNDVKASTVFSSIDSILSVALTAGTIVTAAGLSAAAGPIGFATCMWAALARSAHETHTARKKCDPVYLFYDRLKKITTAKGQIDAMILVDNPEDNLQYLQLQQRSDRLELELKALYNQNEKTITEALNQQSGHHLSQEQYKEMHDLIDKCDHFRTYKKSDGTQSYLLIEPYQDNNRYKKINEHLLAKQQSKFHHRRNQAATWALAAVGMTLLAISIAFPPVAVIGTIVCAVAGALKAQEIYNDLSGLDSGLQQILNRKINKKQRQTSETEQKKLVMELFLDKRPKLPAEAFDKYWSDMETNKPDKLKRLIKRAVRRKVENKLIADYFNQGSDSNASKIHNKTYPQTLTENDRKHLLERALKKKQTPESTKQADRGYPAAGFSY